MAKITTNQDSKSKSNFALIGMVATALWISGVAIFSFINHHRFNDLEPNSWGDFLAGITGPLAIFWLILGFIQQGKELSNSVRAVEQQGREMASSVAEQARVAEASQRQLDLLEQQILSQSNITAYDAYQRFADRMERLRNLEVERPELRALWEGGPEWEALKSYEHPEQFYFVKMLLQANEAFFLALEDDTIPTNHLGLTLDGWRANFKTDLSAPNFAKTWKDWDIVRDSYDRRFQEEVDRLLDEPSKS